MPSHPRAGWEGFLSRYLVPLAPMSVGDGAVDVGGVAALAGGGVLDGAADPEAVPGSAELGAGVWLGGASIGPDVPPAPVGVSVGVAGDLVSSMGGGVLVGLGVPGVVASGRAGSGTAGTGVCVLGLFGVPVDVSNGDRLVPLFTLFGRGGATGVSAAGLPGGSSSEPEPWFGDGLPGVPGACASCMPLTSGAACVRHTFIVYTSAATGRFAAATSSMGIGCTKSITPPLLRSVTSFFPS